LGIGTGKVMWDVEAHIDLEGIPSLQQVKLPRLESTLIVATAEAFRHPAARESWISQSRNRETAARITNFEFALPAGASQFW
jgi:hypothetical protein